MSVSPASKSLQEHGSGQRLFMIINFVTGMTIWIVARLTDDPLAEVNEYGPIINSLSAEWWAVPLSLGATIHLVGQVVNGDPRLEAWVTPLMRLLGSIICLIVMATFVFGGLYAPSTELFVLVHFIQTVMVGGICFWFSILAWDDLKAGIKIARE